MEYKKGDKHLTKNRIFWSYTSKDRSVAKEQWLSPEAYERKCQSIKKYYNSDTFKEKQRNYYNNKKQYLKEKASQNLIYNKKHNPLMLLISSLKIRAKRRNLDFNITLEDLQNLWKNQKGLCYYTKIPMIYSFRLSCPKQMSIDRIDSSKGYTINNIVFCCQTINYAKHDYSFNDFTNFLKELIHFK